MAVVLLVAQVFAFGANAQCETATKSACAAVAVMARCTSLRCPMHRRALPQMAEQPQCAPDQNAAEPAKQNVLNAVVFQTVANALPAHDAAKQILHIDEAQIALRAGPPDRLIAMRV